MTEHGIDDKLTVYDHSFLLKIHELFNYSINSKLDFIAVSRLKV